MEYFDLYDSEFITLEDMTKVENVMIDAEITDDLKLHLLGILFGFNSTVNELKRASALVSFLFFSLIFQIE